MPPPSTISATSATAAARRAAPSGASLADQHAFLRDPTRVLGAGDVIRCGISHPCTAFDKWSLIPVVDDDDVVIDAVRTLF
jgi:D-serine deaminase-like pyridoxal phosphate-dependent protein